MTEERDETLEMAPRDASVIVAETAERARRALQVNRPVLYVAWGLSALVGYGVLWISVHDQHPYRGPGATGLAWTLVAVVLGVGLRLGVLARSTEGIAGPSNARRAGFVLSLVLGTAALWMVDGALAHAGAPRAVSAVLLFAGPMLSLGLVFCASAAAHSDWRSLGLGLWLLVVAVAGAWAGPVGGLAVYALGGGVGFFAAATVATRR
jgi:hypothetical protein